MAATPTTNVQTSKIEDIWKSVTDLGQQFGLLQQTVQTQTGDILDIKQEATSTQKSQSNTMLYVIIGIVVLLFVWKK